MVSIGGTKIMAKIVIIKGWEAVLFAIEIIYN